MPSGQAIDAAFLAANVAAFGGPPYALNVAFGSYSVPAGGAYYLNMAVTTPGTAFVVSGPGGNPASSLDLNGFVLTYNNDTLPFGEDFETTSIGSLPTGWSQSNTSGVSAATSLNSSGPYYLLGSQSLAITGLLASMAGTVTSIGASTTTITTGSAHGLSNGQTVVLAWVAGIANPQVVTVTSSTTFTIPVAINSSYLNSTGYVAASYSSLKTPTITLPRTNRWYVARCAATTATGSQNTIPPFVCIQVVRSSDNAVLADSGTGTAPTPFGDQQGGTFNADGAVVGYFGTETSVYLRFYISMWGAGTAAVAIDHVRLAAACDFAILASNEFNFPGFANLPSAFYGGAATYNACGPFTLTDSVGTGRVQQGAGAGSWCYPINAESNFGAVLASGVKFDTTGDDCGGVYGHSNSVGSIPTAMTRTVTNCTFTNHPPQDVATRFFATYPIDYGRYYGNVSATGNTITNYPNGGTHGIAASAALSGTFSSNTLTGSTSVSNSYGLGIGGCQNLSILHHSITTSGVGENGEGISLDTDASNGINITGEIAYNTVSTQLSGFRDYGLTEPARTLRIRNDIGTLSDGNFVGLDVHDNTFAVTVTGTGMTKGYGAWITLFNLSGNPTPSSNIIFRNNVFQSIVNTSNTTYRGEALVFDGFAPSVCPAFIGNTIISNDIGIAIGDPNEFGTGVHDVLLLANTIQHSSSGDQTRTFIPVIFGLGGNVTSDVRLISNLVNTGSGNRDLLATDLSFNSGTAYSYDLGHTLTVTVTLNGLPVAGATLTVVGAGGYNPLAAPMSATTTDSTGHATFSFGSTPIGTGLPISYSTTTGVGGGSSTTTNHGPFTVTASLPGYSSVTSPSLPMTADTSITIALGGTPVTNNAGRREVGTPFAVTPTMLAGANLGSQPVSDSSASFTAKNLLAHDGWWTTNFGVITYGPDNATPAIWTNPTSTILRNLCYSPDFPNLIDSMNLPSYIGTFTLVYDDPNVNTSSAQAVWMDSALDAANLIRTPVPQSGDLSPITIPPGNVTITSGAITAISFTSPTPVSFTPNYQGAGVLVSGGGGSGFAAVVRVSGGLPQSITSADIICPGSGFSTSGLTVLIYGTKVAGIAITSAFNFAYIAAPSSWRVSIAVYAANASGTWTISNLWLFPPGNTIDRSNPLATDDNVLAALSFNGRSAGTARFMDRTQGDGGPSNFVLPSDLTPSGTIWHTLGQRIDGATFPFARYLNTDSSDPNHSWLTTKCYGPQPYFQAGTDTLISTTGNLTASSPVVSNVPVMANTYPSANLMVGASVSGPGIPAGSYIAYLGAPVTGTITSGSTTVSGVAVAGGTTSISLLSSGMPVYGPGIPINTTVSSIGSTTVTLSNAATGGGGVGLIVGANALFTLGAAGGGLAPATASGTSVSLTITNPPFCLLPPNNGQTPADNGFFVSNNFGSNSTAVVELRSTLPHGMVTGKIANFQGDVTVPFSNVVNVQTGFDAGWQVIGDLASGSAAVANVRLAYSVGGPVSGPGIPSNTTILSIDSASQIHISTNATATGTAVPLNIGGFATSGNTSSTSNPNIITGIPGTAHLQVNEPVVSVASTASGTLTNGSAVVTGLSSTSSLVVGMGVVGLNVPVGANILSIDSGTQIHLTANATGGGSRSLTFSNLPSNAVIGSITGPNSLSLTLGVGGGAADAVATVAAGNLIVTGFRPTVGTGTSAIIYTTGPYTIALAVPVGNSNYPPPSIFSAAGPQVINSNSELSLISATCPNGWIFQASTPYEANVEPYEYGAALAGQSPGMVLWVNVSAVYSDALAAAMGRIIAPHVGPTNPVHVEYSDEDWNNGIGFPYGGWLRGPSILVSYATSGTVCGYAPAPTGPVSGFEAVHALLTVHATDVLRSGFVAAGGSASQVKSEMGSWWGGPGNTIAAPVTQGELDACQRWGASCDHVALGSYLSMQPDLPLLQAFAPAGSSFYPAGSWPLDAINAFFRFHMAYSQGNWSSWNGHARYCQAFGQPLFTATASATGSGGSIPTGNYYLYYTFVDSSSRETTVGLSQSLQFHLTLGQQVGLTMPSWPSWAATLNVYLSAPGAAAGVTAGATLHTISVSQPPPSPAIGSTVSISSFPTSASPPSTNLAAANTPIIPTITSYEGGADPPIPQAVPLQRWLLHDSLLHPSGRDMVYGYFAACQQGDPTFTGSGAVVNNWYQGYTNPNFPDTWILSLGAPEGPGDGTTNAFATIQGGSPADGHDHNAFPSATSFSPTNRAKSTWLQGLVDWFSQSSPLSKTLTRRWFPRIKP